MENLINATKLLTEELLCEEDNNVEKKEAQFLTYSFIQNNILKPDISFLENDDEAEEFFLKQEQLLTRNMQSTTKQKDTQSQIKKRKTTETNKVNDELDLLNAYDSQKFENYLHINKMSFIKIFQAVQHLLRGETQFPANLSLQTVFSLALWKLSTDEHYEEISRKFSLLLSDCQLVVRKFWSIISNNYEKFIPWPNSFDSQLQTLQSFFSKLQRKLPKLFGVIAIKKFHIFLEHEDQEVPVFLQIICNGQYKIIDCCVEYANDYSFDNTLIGQILALSAKTLPRNSYLLGDKSFPLKPYLLRPFVGDKLTVEENLLNCALRPALDIAERVLDMLAARYNILYALEAKDMQDVGSIVETVCCLHNLCIEIKDDCLERNSMEISPFRWSTMNTNISNLHGNESNEEGRKRRQQLLEYIISHN